MVSKVKIKQFIRRIHLKLDVVSRSFLDSFDISGREVRPVFRLLAFLVGLLGAVAILLVVVRWDKMIAKYSLGYLYSTMTVVFFFSVFMVWIALRIPHL
jgi:hypothetical protein